MDRARIAEALARTEVFAQVDGALREHLLDHFEIIELEPEQHLTSAGTRGTGLYVVLRGEFEVVLPGPPPVVVHRGGPDDVVGELGLLTRERSTADVIARTPLQAARLPRAVFEHLDDRFPAGFETILLPILARLRHARLERILRSPGLLGEVDEDTLALIERRLQWVTLQSGQQLVRQGEPGDGMYIVVYGRLVVSIPLPDGTRRRLSEVKRGESVGEIALLADRDRTADVHAIRDSELVWLSRAAFDELVRLRPEFVVHALAGGIVGRMADQVTGVAKRPRRLSTVAVLPLQPGVDLSAFSSRLSAAFDAIGRSIWIDRARVDAVFGTPSIVDAWPGEHGQSILAGWLNEREALNDHVVLQGELGMTPWTQACLRQADHILWVADADGVGQDRRFHAEADRLTATGLPLPESLVLLQLDDDLSGTARWLERHDWRQHHHVRPGVQGDVDRVARFLTDRAVGLVLSGGAARGFAHAGIVRAMRDAGVPIDSVGGVSMGAIMAAHCALELDPDAMIERTLQLTHDVMDRTLPLVSVVRGRRFIHRVREVFGDARIEDLPLPSFYLSANLTQARVEQHDRGSLADAVIASNAPPGLGPPSVKDGDLLVDGFVMNNLPVDRMRGFVDAGPIVAVDVMPARDLPDNADYGRDGLSGWWLLWNKLNPFARTIRFPSIAEIIMRSHEINSVARQRELKGQTPFYVQPDVQAFEMFDYDQGRRIADRAYEAAAAQLKGWAPAILDPHR